MIGIIGIYVLYGVLDIFLKLSFDIASSIKTSIKEETSKSKKFLKIIAHVAYVILIPSVIISVLMGDKVLENYVFVKIISGIVGFALFICIPNSPVHKRYGDEQKDE